MNLYIYTTIYILSCIVIYDHKYVLENVFDYQVDIVSSFIAAIFFYILIWKFAKPKRWHKLPTFEKYIRTHPECRTQEGIRCIFCKNIGVKDIDVDGADKNKRRIVCKNCFAELYREEYAPYAQNGRSKDS